MKIIFLDFDGVLNSLDEIVHSGCYGGGTPLHTRHIEACEFIIKHTDAKVVVSSTWRLSKTTKQLQELLPSLPIIGKTPRIYEHERGFEIQTWLNENKELNVENFIIIDDDSDMGDLLPHLIKTDANYGLTYVEALEAIRMLNGNDDSVWNNFVKLPKLIYREE